MGGWGRRRRFPAVLPALGAAGYCWRGGEGGDGDGIGVAGGRRCFLAGQPLLWGGEIPACAGMTVEGDGVAVGGVGMAVEGIGMTAGGRPSNWKGCAAGIGAGALGGLAGEPSRREGGIPACAGMTVGGAGMAAVWVRPSNWKGCAADIGAGALGGLAGEPSRREGGIPACAGMTVGGAGIQACAGMTVGGAGIGAGGGVGVRRYRQGRIVNYGGISQ